MAAMAVATVSASRIFGRPSDFEPRTQVDRTEVRRFLSSRFGSREIDAAEYATLIENGLAGVVGHEVRIRIAAKDGSEYLTCGCPGGKYAWAGDPTGRGCWAMKLVRSDRS